MNSFNELKKWLSSAFILLYPDVLFSAKIYGIRKYLSLSSYPFLMLLLLF